MPIFNVTVTRNTTETTDVQVDADTAAEANEKALALAKKDPASLDWDLDNDNFHEPYLGDLSSTHEVTAQVRPFTIPAEVHSDDQECEVEFDALDWFKSAADQEILGLANSEWGGDYQADDLAHYMAAQVPEIRSLLRYVELVNENRGSDGFGFACHVEEEPAMKWLETNKPELATKLKEVK